MRKNGDEKRENGHGSKGAWHEPQKFVFEANKRMIKKSENQYGKWRKVATLNIVNCGGGGSGAG